MPGRPRFCRQETASRASRVHVCLIYRVYYVGFSASSTAASMSCSDHAAVGVENGDVRRGGSQEGPDGPPPRIPDRGEGHGLLFEVALDRALALRHGDRDGHEVHPVLVGLVGRLHLRLQRQAVLAPACPELEQHGLFADELGEVDRGAVQVLDLDQLGYLTHGDPDLAAHLREGRCRKEDQARNHYQRSQSTIPT